MNPPTSTDPRPTFFWSAEKSRYTDTSQTKLYPRLMWDGTTGREVTVYTEKEQATHTATGFILSPPASLPAPDPVDELGAALESLSEADRTALFASVQASRIASLRDRMAQLTAEQLEAVLSSAETSSMPEKRGPGRPRKDAAV